MVVARARRAPPAGRTVLRGSVGVGERSVVSRGAAARRVLEGAEEDDEEDGGMILLCRILAGTRWWWRRVLEGTVVGEG
jgi:hypothetical protein